MNYEVINKPKSKGGGWNRGLTKEIDERIRKCAEAISLARMGKSHPHKSHPQLESSRKKQSLTMKKLYQEGKIKPSRYWSGKHTWFYGKKNPVASEYMKNNNPAKRKEVRNKISISVKNLWNNKNYRENQIKSMLSRFKTRPTSLEKKAIEIIKEHNLPYKYVGDGSFLIGFKNPDFINANGRKFCIEVANRFHHQNNYVIKRKEHFAKYGWKCIVIFEDELDKFGDISDII